MPRVRADNDARYALRASFVDGSGDVITGDTITIGGSVQDGDTVGQVTTWSGTEWAPNPNLTIDASGNATFSGRVTSSGSASYVKYELHQGGAFTYLTQTPTAFSIQPNGESSKQFSMDLSTGNATFYKSVTAGNYFIGANAGTLGIPGGSRFEVYEPVMGNDRRVVFQTADLGIPFYIDASGDASFARNVKADSFQFGTFCGIRTSSGTNVIPADGSGAATNGTTDLGANNYQWNVVYADEVRTNTVCSEVNGRAGFTFGSNNVILPANKTTPTNNQADLGRSGNQFKDAYFAGTVNCNTVNETSDEKAKEDIVRAPVGVIERLNGREWVWIESGKKGSGVVAQELEEVLPHLVRTDEEGRKSVAYSGLMGYLIEEVKMLREEIREIKDA